MKGFGYLTKEGFRNIWNNRIMSIASICVLISCLVLTGAATLFSINVSEIVDRAGESNETTAYLGMDVSRLEASYIGKDIEKLDNVVSVTMVKREDAYKDYKELLGDELFETVDEKGNPLPDAFVIKMKDLNKYDQTLKQVTSIEGVERVNDRREAAKMLADLSRLVNLVCVGIVSVLVVISLFIIANTIRTTMYSRRFEISIMKSVGATNAFVRMPFLIEGMIIGVISAAVSTGVIALMYEAVRSAVVRYLQMSFFIPLSRVILPTALLFVAAGIFVGLFGSFISIRKYLKKEGNEILGW